jgi:deoxyribonuclease V
VTVWPVDAATLDAEQHRLAAARPALWHPHGRTLRVGGVFLAFARGQQGPGRAGDIGWAAAALVEEPGHGPGGSAVVRAVAGARYERGRLALREGPALAAALTALPRPADVVLVDATGRDHPRGAGLALHLGAVLDVPTIGVTHRPLAARGAWPPAVAGESSPLALGATVVGAWLRTTARARPLAVHAGWRTDADTAVAVVRRCAAGARTPEPLRRARVAARTARARAEGRMGAAHADGRSGRP